MVGLIKRLLGKTDEDSINFKKKLKDAQEEEKIRKIITERQKPSDERELERLIEKNRQEKISTELKRIRKQEGKELWRSKNNILNKGTSILHQDKSVLNGGKNILNSKHIFLKKGSLK